MRRCKCWLLLGLILLCRCAVAETLVFTGNEARAPKIYNDAAGHAQGVLVEIMKYVATQTGDEYSFKLYPMARAIQSAEHGELGIIGFSKTDERLAKYDYSAQALFNDEVIIVIDCARKQYTTSIEDLFGARIGVTRGGSYGQVYEDQVKNKLFTPIAGSAPEKQLAMLLAGRLDAVLISAGMAGLNTALAAKPSPFKDVARARSSLCVVEKSLVFDPNYVAFAKGLHMQDVLAKIDHAIMVGYHTGAIQKIIMAHCRLVNKYL
jgi:ABC-type amino acid transport substrate-binding protein